MKIFKDTIAVAPTSASYTMPADAAIVAVKMQYNNVTFWYTVPDGAESVTRTFAVVGTGEKFDDHAIVHGSVIDGPFVWHLIELIKETV